MAKLKKICFVKNWFFNDFLKCPPVTLPPPPPKCPKDALHEKIDLWVFPN